MYLVRNITIWLLLSVVLLGAIFLSLSGLSFYKDFKSNYISSKEGEIKAILLGAQAIDAERNKEKINSILKNSTGTEEVFFTKILDLEKKRVFASSKTSEAGGFYEEWLQFKEGEVVKEERFLPYGKIISLTYKKGSLAIWTALDQQFFTTALFIYILKQFFLFLFAAFILFYILYYIERKYLLKPMQELKDTMQELGRKKFEYSENYIPNSFGELLSSFNDISEDVKAILKNEKELSEIKSEFIATTAHQLRTPLSGINWALETIEKDPNNNLSDSQKNIIRRASQKNKELIQMVQELLTTSSIEKGELAYHFEEVAILDIIRSEFTEMKHMGEEKRIEVVFEDSKEEIPKIRADLERIEWVIQNLMENAIRYTSKKGKITLSVERKNDKIIVCVEDTGMGIEEKSREQVFKKFYRSKRAVERYNEGNGLGLYIARRIIEHHGGEIWFETEVDKGTKFCFTLPIKD